MGGQWTCQESNKVFAGLKGIGMCQPFLEAKLQGRGGRRASCAQTADS